MKVSIVVVFVPFLCWIRPVESNTFYDFFVNIPKQIGHAWNTLIEVIKEPVRIRIGKQGRTTTRPTKPVILVHKDIRDLRADLMKQTRVDIRTTAAPLLSPTPSIAKPSPKTTMSSFVAKLIQEKKHKLIIPIIRPITYTKWATYPHKTVTEKARKSTRQSNEDFQRPFKEFVEYTISPSQTNQTINTGPPWTKIKIPVVLQPKYKTVNDWNNLQRPMFAQIQQIAKGSTQSTVSKIMKYYYTDGYYKATAIQPCYSKIREDGFSVPPAWDPVFPLMKNPRQK